MKMTAFKDTGFRANRILKKVFNSIIVILFAIRTVSAYALPQVDDIVSGDAEVVIDGNTMTVTAADGTAIDYNSFNIGENESVVIILPSSTSQILNNVIGGEASNLMGYLSCNGLFILVNPAGINVGPTATLDVASMIMSTRTLSVDDFLDKDYIFNKLSDEEKDMLLLNEGNINIQDGGFGVLIAGAIENNGKIVAKLGTVALATGDAVRLDVSDDGLISIAIDEAVAQEVLDFAGNPITDQIKNSGGIEADGGYVVMKAESLTDIFNNAINLDGYVVANKFDGKEGRIELVASDDIHSTGTLEAKEGSIYLESDGEIRSYGTIETESLIERGASFRVGGIFHVGLADLCNLDNAVYFGDVTHVSGTITDPGNIIIEGTVFLDDDTTFIADSDLNGDGGFIMNVGSLITSDGVQDLSIYASQGSTLNELTNIDTLSIYSNAGYSPTYTVYNHELVVNNFSLYGLSGSFAAPVSMTVAENCNIYSGHFAGSTGLTTGTFLLSGGTFDAPYFFNITNGNFMITGGAFNHNNGTVQYNISNGEHYMGWYDFNGNPFYNLILAGCGDPYELETPLLNISDMTVLNDLTIIDTDGAGLEIHTEGPATISIGGDLKIDSADLTVEGVMEESCIILDLMGETSSFEMLDGSLVETVTLRFSGSGTQEFTKTGGEFLGNFEVDKSSGVVLLNSNIHITSGTGEVNILNGTLDANGYDIWGDCLTLSSSGTLRLKGNEFLNIIGNADYSGTVEYYGSGNYATLAAGFNYYNLVFSGSGTYSHTEDINVDNNLTIEDGTFTAPTNLTVGGDFKIDGGAFNHNNGTVIFDDATKISHIYGTTFYNLKCETGGKEIRFSTDSTKTVEGNLTLTGGPGMYIKLRSIEDGTQWSIDPQGDITVYAVDVKDSNNLNGNVINPPNSTNSGNNTNWFTGDTPPLDPPTPDPPTPDPPNPDPPTPNPPQPPDPPQPPQIGDDGDEVEIEMAGRGFDYDIVYEEGEWFKKPYAQGKYRTIVIVHEGCVVAAPYDEDGADYKRGTVLTAGQKTSQEGEVE